MKPCNEKVLTNRRVRVTALEHKASEAVDRIAAPNYFGPQYAPGLTNGLYRVRMEVWRVVFRYDLVALRSAVLPLVLLAVAGVLRSELVLVSALASSLHAPSCANNRVVNSVSEKSHMKTLT